MSKYSRVVLFAILPAVLSTDSAIAQGPPPWLEGYEIPTLNSITTAERLRQAQVMVVDETDLTPCLSFQCPAAGYLLDVHGWETVSGTGAPGDPDLCQETPLFGQATPGQHCSGTLVGENFVLSAGHCFSQAAGCLDYSVVFDYELAFAGDPTGDPSSGQIFLREDQVIPCLDVVTSPPGGGDWAVLELESPVPPSRLPAPIERVEITDVGTEVICTTHPARLPLKAELAQVVASFNKINVAECFTLGGSSGGGMWNLDTGQLAGIAVANNVALPPGNPPPDPCLTPCFDCYHDVSMVRPSLAAASVPWIGLRLNPLVAEMDWYGPPTSAADYATRTLTLSADLDHSRAVNWQFVSPLPGIDIVSGPSAGTLLPGGQVIMELAPDDAIVQEPGTPQLTTFHRDSTYQAQHPIKHTFHVGVDGFDLSPEEDFVGEGPGALPYETKRYSLANRWAVAQAIEVSVDVPWVRFNGSPGPVTVSMPPNKGGAVVVGLDAAGMPQGVHSGRVIWRSLDSGSPAFERTTGVLMDVGRQILGGPFSPPWVLVVDDTTPVVEYFLTVNSFLPEFILDADALVHATVTAQGGLGGLDMTLTSPDGTTVGLDGLGVGSTAETYDDVTNPPVTGTMADFNDENAYGTWTLRLERIFPSGTYTVSLNRFEVRLYTTGPGSQ